MFHVIVKRDQDTILVIPTDAKDMVDQLQQRYELFGYKVETEELQ